MADGITVCMQMDLFTHTEWLKRFCCTPGCCRKEHARRVLLLLQCPWALRIPQGSLQRRPESLAGAVCFQHHLSQGPMAVASRICTTPMTGESEEPCGKTAVGCLNSPATPRANSSRLQRNCCELQVASGSMSSRAGSQPKDLIFITIIQGGPLNLHIQVAQSPFFPGRLPARVLPRLFLLHRLSCLCWDVVQVVWGLILRKSTALICSFSKVRATHMEIL